MFFTEPKTLVVVCKDELQVNQLRKLVETKDDTEEAIVGTKDGSVKIVAWSEDVWLDQKKAGNLGAKVLLIGNIDGVDKLLPVLDIKFEEFGVKYGWAGNQAVIVADPRALANEKDYNAFLEKLSELPVPESIKKRAGVESKDVLIAGGVGALFGIVTGFIAGVVSSLFSNEAAVKQQMLFYGILKLYYNHLEEYMEA